jgi:hypothetical protein
MIDGLVIAARGGAAQDLTTGLSRGWVGPELSLPRLFAGAGGLSAAYQEERGFDSGRSAWVQAVVASPAWLRFTATGSWTYTQDGAYHADELGLALGAAARLSELVQLQATLLSRLGSAQGPLRAPLAAGATGTAQIEGRF